MTCVFRNFIIFPPNSVQAGGKGSKRKATGSRLLRRDRDWVQYGFQEEAD